MSHFPPFTALRPAYPLLPTLSPFSSCPWVVHISSLALTFPILFLPSPCLFSTYHLCYLFYVPFPPLSPSHSPADNPPHDLHFCGFTFPILFLPSPCLFSTYHLCYFFSVPFPPLSPSHSPADNPPCDLHFCDSVLVLVVCFVYFCFRLGC